MKTPKAVVAILCAILAVNIVGVALHTVEMRKQTDIALKTAELEAIEAHLAAYEMYVNGEDSNGKAGTIHIEAMQREACIQTIRGSLGIDYHWSSLYPIKREYLGKDNTRTGYGLGDEIPDFLK